MVAVRIIRLLFPTWPEEQFNLATLAGEQKNYDTAIFHMKKYLELAPDSPGVQNAQKQHYLVERLPELGF